MRPQVAPLPHGQIPQRDTANTNAFEAHHLEAHLLAHAPDLALFALGQDEAKLLRILPLNQGRFEFLAIQT